MIDDKKIEAAARRYSEVTDCEYANEAWGIDYFSLEKVTE